MRKDHEIFCKHYFWGGKHGWEKKRSDESHKIIYFQLFRSLLVTFTVFLFCVVRRREEKNSFNISPPLISIHFFRLSFCCVLYFRRKPESCCRLYESYHMVNVNALLLMLRSQHCYRLYLCTQNTFSRYDFLIVAPYREADISFLL